MPTGKGVLAELCDELVELCNTNQIESDYNRNSEGHLYGAIRIYPNGGAVSGTVYVVLINRGDDTGAEVYKVVDRRQVASKIITRACLFDLLEVIRYRKHKLMEKEGIVWEF